jgi:hypothetical protein
VRPIAESDEVSRPEDGENPIPRKGPKEGAARADEDRQA